MLHSVVNIGHHVLQLFSASRVCRFDQALRTEKGEANNVAVNVPAVDELRFEELDLAALAHEVVKDFGVNVQSHPLHFYGDTARIIGDAEHLRKLVLTLLANAAEYSEDGREIKVDVWKRGANVCLFVQDDGKSQRPVETERMFLPFTPFDGTAKTGSESEEHLASVKRISDTHGAQLRVQGTLGHGTIFEVCFKARAGQRRYIQSSSRF